MSAAYEVPTCARCEMEYTLREGQEPTRWCDECAQQLAEFLAGQVSEKDETIARLTRELSELKECCVKLVAVWDRNGGRVIEAMGDENPRVESIVGAVEAVRALTKGES